MELFAKIVQGFRLISIFVKSSILDVRLGSEYPSAGSKPLLTFSKNKATDLFIYAPIGTFLKQVILDFKFIFQ